MRMMSECNLAGIMRSPWKELVFRTLNDPGTRHEVVVLLPIFSLTVLHCDVGELGSNLIGTRVCVCSVHITQYVSLDLDRLTMCNVILIERGCGSWTPLTNDIGCKHTG